MVVTAFDPHVITDILRNGLHVVGDMPMYVYINFDDNLDFIGRIYFKSENKMLIIDKFINIDEKPIEYNDTRGGYVIDVGINKDLKHQPFIVIKKSVIKTFCHIYFVDMKIDGSKGDNLSICLCKNLFDMSRL